MSYGVKRGLSYIIKFSGFVVFVNNMSEDDVWQRTIFDIEYEGNSRNGNSGRAKLINNHVRELVTNNIETYRQMAREPEKL